ncbi:MAG: hypothetical protein RIT81_25780 [Deltaproteobacteria bacterium]
MKIPPPPDIEKGLRVLGEVYEEIDRQIGAEEGTRDDKVSDHEVAKFLAQRGGASDAAGAALATFSAYMRHVAASSDVPVDDIKRTLGDVQRFVDRDRDADLDVADMKPTWRALTLFAAEVKSKGLSAESIVSDRSGRPIGDVAALAKGLSQMSRVFAAIGEVHGGGAITVDAIKAYLAAGPDVVATSKSAVRRVTRLLEHRTGGTTFTQADVDAAMNDALTAYKKNADGPDDRKGLARTWQSLAAFADENAVRNKTPETIVGTATTTTTTTPATGGPRAADVAAFRALDTDTKAEILEDYGNLFDYYVASGEVAPDTLDGPRLAFAKAMERELISIVGDFEEDSGVYGTIGSPRVRVEVIELPTGEVVGGRIWMHQDGFNSESGPTDANGDRYYHFDTAREAEAAGADPHEDINWQVHGLFEVAPGGGAVQLGGSYEHVSDYWEWSGH